MEDNREQNRFAKYLPLGTVVLLRGAEKKLMITGYCSAAVDNPKEIYDYSGCLYPEGFISSDQTCLFNHKQIGTIYHLGYVNEEQKKFMNVLKETANKIEMKQNNL